MKVFIGAQELSGLFNRLNNAFHDLNIESDYYCLYQYTFEINNSSKHSMKLLARHRRHVLARTKSKSCFMKELFLLLQMIDIISIYIYALRRYDYYIYMFGHGMFHYHKYLQPFQELEFWLLKLFKKKVVMWFLGADSRPPYCDVDIYNEDYEKIYQVVLEKKRNVARIEKYMMTIDSPSSSHFHNNSFIITNMIGIPVDIKELVNRSTTIGNNSKITIMHAPSNIDAKGTAIIRKIMEELKVSYNIDYIEISGKPHSEVLKAFEQADIVIDQLYSDTPMAGLATEAAINGIPVIVGGYFSDIYKNIMKNNVNIEPTIYCNTDEVKEKLIQLIEDEHLRKEIGEKEKEYVFKEREAKIVAKRFVKIYNNDIDDAWMYNPGESDYIYGSGASKEKVEKNVVKLISLYGSDALGISKEKRLYKEYMDLYNRCKDFYK